MRLENRLPSFLDDWPWHALARCWNEMLNFPRTGKKNVSISTVVVPFVYLSHSTQQIGNQLLVSSCQSTGDPSSLFRRRRVEERRSVRILENETCTHLDQILESIVKISNANKTITSKLCLKFMKKVSNIRFINLINSIKFKILRA